MGRPLSPTRDLAPGRLGLRDWSVQDQVSGAAHLVKRRAPNGRGTTRWARNTRPEHIKLREKGLAGAEGLEPTTLGFGDRCSTN